MHPNVFWSYLSVETQRGTDVLSVTASQGHCQAYCTPLCHMETNPSQWRPVKFMMRCSCQVAFSLRVSWLMFLLEVLQTDGSAGCLWSRAVSRFSALKIILNHSTTCPIYTEVQVVCVCVCASVQCIWWFIGKTVVCVHVRLFQWLYTCYPDVQCDPTLLSLSCLKQFQMACGVQTLCRRKRPTKLP